MSALRPLRDQIVVRPEAETASPGGIALIDAKKYQHGTVVAVGPGRKTRKGVVIPLDVKVGDRICFEPVGTRQYTRYGEHLVMQEADIACILDN